MFVKHKELVTNQYATKGQGNKLHEETCTVQMDFAENFLSSLGEDIHPVHLFQQKTMKVMKKI